MLNLRRSMGALLFGTLVACSVWALPYAPQKGKKPAAPPPQPTQSDQQQQPPDQQADQPKPLATGTVTIKSSRQGKEAASAGYNGIGDDGKVLPTALNMTPSAADSQKALQLSVYAVSDSDVQAFIKEGNLNLPGSKR